MNQNLSLSNVVVCGSGFLGSWWSRIFAQRARSLHFEIRATVVDMDQFDERNEPTQFMTPKDVGKGKAYLSAKVFEEFGYEAHAFPYLLTTTMFDELPEVFSNVSLVVDSFDNLPGRLSAKRLSQRFKCPCLHLSMSEQHFGKVEWQDKWSLDPDRMLELRMFTEVTLDPCELIAYLPLGIAIASRGAVEASALLAGESVSSWSITAEEQKRI